MPGTHADSVITEAYLKGVTDFDVEAAYEAMKAHATGPVPHGGRGDIEDWINLGYLASDHSGSAGSTTLEYSYDDWCISRLADALGKTDDRDMFLAHSKNYANVWDPATKFFRGRASDGSFAPADGFVPAWFFYDDYDEGNAWQYRWLVPHDVPGLIDLFGGKEYFTKQLQVFFSGKGPHNGVIPEFYYWHGNEPDLQAAYLFNDVGRPDLTSKAVRWIMSDLYGDGPAGLYGNDDGGTLSAWYVLSALGLYAVAPCSGVYYIGSPIFTKATVRMGNKTLVITAENASEKNIYVQSVALNGVPLDAPYVKYGDLAGGGTLDFVMGSEPSGWGR